MDNVERNVESNVESNVEGELGGEVCNRDGCTGIIVEGEQRGDGCSCFQSAPCSYCCQNTEYCPKCGWEADQP